jgi:hypothetical protein
MSWLSKLVIGALVIGGVIVFLDDSPSKPNEPVASKVDLNRILDVTVNEILSFESILGEELRQRGDPDLALFAFSESLQKSYNETAPALHTSPVAIAPLVDATLLVVEDLNMDGQVQDSENTLWTIEIDGQNSRVIASSWQGEVRDSNVGGMGGFFAGYLMGSMLNRQSVHGTPSNVAQKRTAAPQSNARSRAGSGSHFRGK